MEEVLILDGPEASYSSLGAILEFMDCESVTYNEARQWLTMTSGGKGEYRVAFISDQLLGMTDVLSEVRGRLDQTPIFIISADKAGVHAGLPAGVLGNISFPPRYQELSSALQQADIFRNSRVSGKQPDKHKDGSPELFRSMVGNSRGIKAVRRLIEQVSNSEATVLILGESGTGKEVVARNLHYHSDRRDKPFVPVNCGAIPQDLLESELFGHEKGAFTGAISARQGRFELAEGGTLFLDEIGDMSLHMQVKLLRVLQEKTFSRVGSNKLLESNVRIIAATHRNLERAIQEGNFREDLYYRLNVFPIEMPPLRERSEDIHLLIKELITRFEHQGRGSVRLSQAAIYSLCQYHWPGNVRELANLVERLIIMFPYSIVDIGDLPAKYQTIDGPTGADVEGDEVEISSDPGLNEAIEMARLPRGGIDLKKYLNDLECDLIRQALNDANGVVAHAASKLKLRRTTLVEKLRKYGLHKADEVT